MDMWFTGGTAGVATSNNMANAQSFALSILPGYTEFTSLFDYYRIDKIELTFIPSTNVADANTTAIGGNNSDVSVGVNAVPTMLIATDPDGANYGATVAEQMLLQYGNHRKLYMSCAQRHTFKPKVSQQIYGAGATTAYAVPLGKDGVWVDCNNPTAPHYGVLWYVVGSNNEDSHSFIPTTWQCKVYAKYTVSFKATV